MNTKRLNIFTSLLLLAVVAGGSSACSLTKIKAQSPETKPAATNVNNTANSSETTYKPPKRVSKDIIKIDEKPAKKQTK